MTPPLENKTLSGAPSATDVLLESHPGSPTFKPDPIPPPTCTPTNVGSPTREFSPSPIRRDHVTSAQEEGDHVISAQEEVEKSSEVVQADI